MTSGTIARTSLPSIATRFSFWISSRSTRPESVCNPSIRAAPRTNPPAIRRSTSTILPSSSLRALSSRSSALIGSSAAIARPIRSASVIEPRAVARRACAAVIVYSVNAARPPSSIERARAIRSNHSPSCAQIATRLQRSSVSTAGDGLTPAISIVTCDTFGNARPIPSASAIGSPARAAQPIGFKPFDPPISTGIRATTVLPDRPTEPGRAVRLPAVPRARPSGCHLRRRPRARSIPEPRRAGPQPRSASPRGCDVGCGRMDSPVDAGKGRLCDVLGVRLDQKGWEHGW